MMPSPSRGGEPAQTKPASSSGKLSDKDLRVRFAYLLDAPTPRGLNLDEVLHWESKQGPVWVHLDHVQTIPEWLKDHHAIDHAVLQSLLAEARRPRVEVVRHENLVIVFRTANVELTPTADLTQNTRACPSHAPRNHTFIPSLVDLFVRAFRFVLITHAGKIPKFQ
jgi:Mg2+ and Co2+ transporter CorA